MKNLSNDTYSLDRSSSLLDRSGSGSLGGSRGLLDNGSSNLLHGGDGGRGGLRSGRHGGYDGR